MKGTTTSTQEEVLLARPKDNNDDDSNKNNNMSLVVKGKRTKRQRPQSPLHLTIIPSRGHEGGCRGNYIDQYGSNIIGLTNNHDDNSSNNNNYNFLSPTTSIEFQKSTEEEEDMAHCLILLARGQFQHMISPKRPSHSGEHHAGINKYNSRRLLETSGTGGTGKSGYYVYECRTCNRTFPSFQALGGHRASHKKHMAMTDGKRNNNNFVRFLSSYEDYDHDITLKNNDVSSAFSLQLSQRNLYGINNNNNSHNKPKVHECSICGAEFNSGQALGGHMRRHRTIATGTNTSLSLTPIAIETYQEQFEQPKKANKNVLSMNFDLNLPAPEDDNRESKFSFVSSKQQQSSLVFSAPALVGCHY